MEPGNQFRGIKVEGVSSKRVGAFTVHQGRVADGQTGYRAVHERELEPRSAVPGTLAHGYRSFGKYSVAPERGSRGGTQFAAAPLSHEEMHALGATHQVEVDISGLPFRSLRAPEGEVHHADLGLGLAVKGEMRWDRIKRVVDREGRSPEWADGNGYSSPGEQIAVEHMMDSGEHYTRGR
jgi:hypothetical protein